MPIYDMTTGKQIEIDGGPETYTVMEFNKETGEIEYSVKETPKTISKNSLENILKWAEAEEKRKKKLAKKSEQPDDESSSSSDSDSESESEGSEDTEKDSEGSDDNSEESGDSESSDSEYTYDSQSGILTKHGVSEIITGEIENSEGFNLEDVKKVFDAKAKEMKEKRSSSNSSIFTWQFQLKMIALTCVFSYLYVMSGPRIVSYFYPETNGKK
ncbi:hypothetical protein CRE_18176 [Caenorhabditis remanei]|uniref:Uncharacterized protein n=1 Tax=Caenorhabditis remanei TaxID=31234 RepID=E3N8J9_CAERE|nr:hypothetical protein CRE_18176 [Caenorhabditis remanei]